MQEVKSLEPSLRKEVESIIPGLLPPSTMEQAEQLSAAGESLIPLLASHWSRHADKEEEMTRAASMIGGSDAIDLIRDIARQAASSFTFGSEISRAWQYFDTEDFAKRVLASQDWAFLFVESEDQERALRHVSSIKVLTIRAYENRVIDLNKGFPPQELKGIFLGFASEVRNLSKLAVCHQLDWINFSSIEHLDLADFTLRKPDLDLSFYGCGDVDLTPLASLARLKIEHDKETRLNHVDMLAEGSTVRLQRRRLGSFWPFS